MLDYTKYDKETMLAQNDNVRLYSPALVGRGAAAKTAELLALVLILTPGKADAPKRKGGGDSKIQTVRRWFTDVPDKKNTRPLLPKNIVGETLLEQGGPRELKVIIAQGLSKEGIERETESSDGDESIHEEYHSTLADAAQYCHRLIHMNESGMANPGDKFLRFNAPNAKLGISKKGHVRTMLAAWYKLEIRLGGNLKWVVIVHWRQVTSDEMMKLIDRAIESETTQQQRQEQEISGEMMAASLPKGATAEQALEHFALFGWIANPWKIKEGVYAADLGEMADTWARFARMASKATAGNWWYRSGSIDSVDYKGEPYTIKTGGITWRNGGKTELIIISPESLAPILAAQKVQSDLTGNKEDAWSISAIARQLLEWVMPDGTKAAQGVNQYAHLVDTGKWGYTMVQPMAGGEAQHIDVSSYYYNLALRAPSPRPIADSERPVKWRGKGTEESERWQTMLRTIGANKALRNTLVGCMASGGPVRNCYHKGEQWGADFPNNSFAPMGWLIARTGWEMCREAAEQTKSGLAITDCVVTDRGVPKVWKDAGFPMKIVSEGEVQICSATTFKVGERETKPYKLGDRASFPKPPVEKPAFEYYRSWAT